MSRLPKGHWVPINGASRCEDCGKPCSEFRWNTNRRAKIRHLCQTCYENRLISDQERRFGLVNWAAKESRLDAPR